MICTRCCSTCPPNHIGSLCPACLKITGTGSSIGSGAGGVLGCLTLILGTAICCAIGIHACSDDKPLHPPPISPDVAQRFAEPEQTAPVVSPVVTAAQSRANRIDYAETYERLMLKAGMDATVRTEGKNADTLVITYILVDRPLVYNMLNDSETTDEWKLLGFKRVRFSDGYESSWSQSLK